MGWSRPGSEVLDANVYLLADLHELRGIKRYMLCVPTYMYVQLRMYVDIAAETLAVSE